LRVRELRPDDIPTLTNYAEVSGFEYPDFDDPHIEAFLVVVDSEDQPIAGCAAKRLIELYGYFDPSQSPATKMAVLKSLHQGMAMALRAKGYNSASVGIHPRLAKTFGRRLKRSFGWLRNTFDWWSIRF
jgi:hypothetical protein